MTHDELLNKLGKMPCYPDNKEQLMLYIILRAVVELHRPIGKYCQRCSVNDWGQQQQEYPCETIQAIEKELL